MEKRKTANIFRTKLCLFLWTALLTFMPAPYPMAVTLQKACAAEAENTTAESTAAENTAADNTAVKNTAAENTTAVSTAAESTAAKNTSAENTAAVSTAAENAAAENTAAENTTAESTAAQTAPAVTDSAAADTGKEDTGKAAAKNVFNSRIRKLSGGKFIRKGKWYYYRKKNGKFAVNGLYKIKGKIYCLDSRGRRRSGWRKIDGVNYYFGRVRQGYMYRKTWASIGGKRYYFTKTGKPATGWQIIGTKQYYFRKNGSLCTTRKKIDGISCRFNDKGEVTGIGPSLKVVSPCALIMEVKSGKIIYAKNPDLPHANASTTKIMTAILTLENARLTDAVRVSYYAASMEPTKLGMISGDSFKLEDLLYSLLVASGNDTAVALAEHVSGTVSKFAARMNKRAAELGCMNTHFVTPSGLDAGLNHYTTARDLAIIARHALGFKKFRQVIRTASYNLTSYQGRYYSIKTTNELLNNMPGVKGIKTGFTRKAGNCFVGLIKAKNKKEYITVNLGASESSQRWADARTLLTWAASQ